MTSDAIDNDYAMHDVAPEKWREYRGFLEKSDVNVQERVLAILDEVLNLKGRTRQIGWHSPLLGAIPELDSMAVVSLITTMEDQFGFTVADDELDGSRFATLGTLTEFVQAKMQA